MLPADEPLDAMQKMGKAVVDIFRMTERCYDLRTDGQIGGSIITAVPAFSDLPLLP